MWIKLWSIVIKIAGPIGEFSTWAGAKVEQMAPILLVIVSMGLTIVLINQLQLSREQSQQTNRDAATLCVQAWDGRTEVRDMVLNASVQAALAGNASILDAVREISPNPELVTIELEDTLRRITIESVTPQVEAVIAQYPDPECDLEDAKRVLEEAK